MLIVLTLSSFVLRLMCFGSCFFGELACEIHFKLLDFWTLGFCFLSECCCSVGIFVIDIICWWLVGYLVPVVLNGFGFNLVF